MTMPSARPAIRRGPGVRILIALVLTATLVMVPLGAVADTSGGQASAYLAYRDGANSCNVWSPLFSNGADGWTSTIVVNNVGTAGVTIDFRMRSVLGGGLISRSISIPSEGTRQITGADLGLPDGFRGSLAGTASPCGEIAAVTFHDAPGRNRIALESVEAAAQNLVIPLAFNDVNGWNSMVLLQNTSRDVDTTVTITYRGTDLPTVETSATVRRESSLQLDLAQAPKGALSIQVENETSGKTLVAAAYHLGPNGMADGNNSFSDEQGSRKIFIPLLFRKYGDYDSGVRVVSVKEGGAQPKITFYDPDSNERIGSVTSPKTLREGEETTFYLPTIELLQDNRKYSAIVEAEPGGSEVLVALANHVNYRRNTAMLYAGTSRGDTSLVVPLVYRAASGLNSGIQVQNTTGSQGSVTVRFKSMSGQTIATVTQTVQGNNSTTIYLPTVANLPDGFIGSARISGGSTPITATVNTVRYTSPSSSPESGT